MRGHLCQIIKRSSSTAASASSMSQRLKGIFPPIVTPFNAADESISWDKLEHNINKWNKAGLSGYLVHGSNGEFCYQSEDERIKMVQKVREMTPPEMLVLAGSGCESTTQTVEMTKAMAAVGADVAFVITPNYYKAKMKHAEFMRHFTTVADASPIPVVLYNVPANTSVELGAETVRQLASHPNIIGIKESNGNIVKIAQMVHETAGYNFKVLAGSASYLLPSLHVGAVGSICAVANVLPEEVVKLQRLFEAGDEKRGEALALQQKLIYPNNAVTSGFGPPGLKTAMEWFGFYGGPPRTPMLPLTESETKTLRSQFEKGGYL